MRFNPFRNRSIFRQPAAKRARRATPPPALMEFLEPRILLSAATGGFTGGGLLGRYYANTTMSGAAVFSRTDSRVDFNWNTSQTNAVSGSPSFPFPDTQFSVKWTGAIIPKYSQTYTFTTVSEDGARLFVNGQELINDWTSHLATTDSGTIALAAGQSYSIELDYYQGGDAGATAQLMWSSPSTAQEVIGEAAPIGINVGSFTDSAGNQIYADAMRSHREWGSPQVPYDQSQGAMVDANGWPTRDFGVVVQDPPENVENGTYTLSFNGEAQVKFVASNGTFDVGGTSYAGTLPSGVGYDAATNTTTAQVVIQNQFQTMFAFTGTQRTASSAMNTGLTNVKFMRPTSPGATTSFSPNTLFDTPVAALMSNNFSTIRYMDATATNNNTQQNWTDRPLPGNSSWVAMPWELAVALANETGKDMYINIPEMATNAYITDLANLIKYGSDGVNPYTSAQANPVWAPLSSNLRVYIEYSNEVWNGSVDANGVWNGGFEQYAQNQSAAAQAVLNGTAEGQIINYDGVAGTYNGTSGTYAGQGTLDQRYHALRLKETSDIFRGVFGNAAMGSTIRPILEWFYGGGWFGNDQMLGFLNTYFNNADGQLHVTNPEPVNYYLWGGGGGWYYSPVHPFGGQDGVTPDPNFTAVTVNDYQQDPTGGPWTFTGTAGVAATSGSSLGVPTYDPTPYPLPKQVGLIQGSGTFTESVTISPQSTQSFAAEVVVSVASIGTADPLDVYVDGNLTGVISPTFGFYQAQSTVAAYASSTFTTTAGTHTIEFVGTGAAAATTVFYGLRVGTVDGIYAGGMTLPATVAGDVALARSYGLHDVGYEGGLDIGDYGATRLQMLANADPRAAQATVAGYDATYQYGMDLPVVFQLSAEDGWAIAPNALNDGNAPKVQGIQQIEQSLAPTPTNGTTLPTTVGQYVSIAQSAANYGVQTNPVVTYLLYAPQPGLYTIAIHGTQAGASTVEHFMLDGQRVPGATVLPQAGSAAGNSTAVTFAITTPGLHGISLFVDGPSGISLDGGGTTVTYVSGTVPTSLPAGWSNADIGSPTPAGSATSYDAVNWTVRGAGAGIGGMSDQFNYAYQTVSGNHSIIAQVAGETDTAATANAGVTFRDGNAADAAFAYVQVGPSGVDFSWRGVAGGAVSDVGLVAGDTAPMWVLLSNSGGTFSAFVSSDGANWNQLGTSQSIHFTNTDYLAGLAVGSANSSALNVTNFANVQSVDRVIGLTIGNAGFEMPAQTGGNNAYTYDPSNAGWIFTGRAGIEANGSAWGAPTAPNGTQAAFLQSGNTGGPADSGQISQVLDFTSVGAYAFQFNIASRFSPAGTQQLGVYLDGTLVNAFTPSSIAAWDTDVVTLNIAAIGYHTLTFAAMNSAGDQSVFLDNVAVVTRLSNASFESPQLGGGNYAYTYDPSNAGWTFTGNAGLEANGSAWGAPNAPDGTQAAFLQSAGAGHSGINGQISQVLNFTTTGTYTLQFNAAPRYSPAGNQRLGVYLDGTLLESQTPAGATSWDVYQVSLNIATTGNHTLMFAALNSAGDQSVFVDNVQIVDGLFNGGFESPQLGGNGAYSYDPSNAGWTFTGNAGIEANGSAWGAPAAPNGTQAAFLQSAGAGQAGANGQISQVVTFTASGTYTLQFDIAARGYISGGNQQLGVYLDGTLISTFTPSGTTGWDTELLSLNIAAAGSHTVTFAALNSAGDESLFLDNVQIM